MKKIIAGQIMMWGNLTGVVIGYILFKMTGIESDYVHGLLAFLGIIGAGFNLCISISLQLKGYKEDGIINLID
jgi:hypothetical protein